MRSGSSPSGKWGQAEIARRGGADLVWEERRRLGEGRFSLICCHEFLDKTNSIQTNDKRCLKRGVKELGFRFRK
jgi:hypothetical protein